MRHGFAIPATGVALVLAGLGALDVSLFLDEGHVERRVRANLEALLAWPVRFDAARFHPWQGLALEGLRIGPGPGGAALRLDRLLVTHRPLGLLTGRFVVASMATPALTVVRGSDANPWVGLWRAGAATTEAGSGRFASTVAVLDEVRTDGSPTVLRDVEIRLHPDGSAHFEGVARDTAWERASLRGECHPGHGTWSWTAKVEGVRLDEGLRRRLDEGGTHAGLAAAWDRLSPRGTVDLLVRAASGRPWEAEVRCFGATLHPAGLPLGLDRVAALAVGRGDGLEVLELRGSTPGGDVWLEGGPGGHVGADGHRIALRAERIDAAALGRAVGGTWSGVWEAFRPRGGLGLGLDLEGDATSARADLELECLDLGLEGLEEGVRGTVRLQAVSTETGLAGTLSAPALRVCGSALADLYARLEVEGHRAVLSGLEADLWGGRLEGECVVESAPSPAVYGRLRLTGGRVRQLPGALAPGPEGDGRLDGDVRFARGGSDEALRGEVTLELGGGTWDATLVRRILAAAAAGGDPAHALTRVDSGRATIRSPGAGPCEVEAWARAGGLALAARGTVGPGARLGLEVACAPLEVAAALSVCPEAKFADVFDEVQTRLHALRVTGTMAAPEVLPEADPVAEAAARALFPEGSAALFQEGGRR
ncbi:MAG: hypothetical protein HY722_15725 [Planctomycetes bacterium]|nr:hypothetical protein [Planctomycetota bacterium]